ncbi:sulfotransferase family 2 domain-containing protein [bacterium]|nr:sulfotransferase family 2 domain-containing protein [bacterium]
MRFSLKKIKSKAAENQILFLHIQKTAGTAFGQYYLPKAFPYSIWSGRQLFNKFSNIEESQSSRNKILNLTEKEKSIIKVLFGHQVHYVTDLFPRAKIMTFVRNPVDRAISQYLYERRFIKELDIGNRQKFKTRPLPDEVDDFWDYFLEWGKDGNFSLQTRTIINFINGKFDNLETIFSDLNKFSFIGSQNHFKESIVILNKMFDFPILEVPFKLKEKYLILKPNDKIKSEIKQESFYDNFIYEYACSKFLNIK